MRHMPPCLPFLGVLTEDERFWKQCHLLETSPSLKLTANATWKWMVGRRIPFPLGPKGLFSGGFILSGSVPFLLIDEYVREANRIDQGWMMFKVDSTSSLVKSNKLENMFRHDCLPESKVLPKFSNFKHGYGFQVFDYALYTMAFHNSISDYCLYIL